MYVSIEDIIYNIFHPTAPSFVLESFALLQQLPLSASRLELLQEPNSKTEVLAIWHKHQDLEQVNTYAWQSQEQQFVYNASKSVI